MPLPDNTDYLIKNLLPSMYSRIWCYWLLRSQRPSKFSGYFILYYLCTYLTMFKEITYLSQNIKKSSWTDLYALWLMNIFTVLGVSLSLLREKKVHSLSHLWALVTKIMTGLDKHVHWINSVMNALEYTIIPFLDLKLAPQDRNYVWYC